MPGFYMPVRVYEENEAVSRHAAELAALGKKALIVTGRNSAFINGSFDDVTRALEGQGTAWSVFRDVEENPSTDTIMRARDLGLEEGADFVIGIGGGSPMDAAKAVALMIRHRDRDISYLYSPDGDSSALPVAEIPTTCGTGSEVTAVSVLTDPVKERKKSIPHEIFPKLALIDGKYLRFAGKSVIANTAFDALTHLIESYLNTKSDAYSRMCVDAGLATWALSQPVFRGEREPDDSDFVHMMRASAMAGMAIAHTATTIPHGLSYTMTVKLGVPHGKATAYFTAGYLAEADEADRNYLLERAGFRDIGDYRAVYRAACGEIDADGALLREVIEAAVDELVSSPQKLALTPFKTDGDVLRRIAFFETEA